MTGESTANLMRKWCEKDFYRSVRMDYNPPTREFIAVGMVRGVRANRVIVSMQAGRTPDAALRKLLRAGIRKDGEK